MKQDWRNYRDTYILGAAMAGKEKSDEQAAQEKQQQTMGGF